ncbi:Oligo-1,6-glucosidase [Periweissella ghanensis]|uniref:Oligo-1,6-glucosidase n=1 Tax=Periweissella ghanensis TaxID=467997 RepID=A0ABM8Z8Z5_9LACO|nr:Oligo-1,6-glucosidase [Periweissella ghanensis]
MQGTPYIYQGEEIGMTNAYNLDRADFNDIEIKNAYQYLVETDHLVDAPTFLKYVHAKGRDNARTPMQWNANDQAGFTTGTPWLKVNDNYPNINVAAALADPDSIFYHYQKLIELRHTLPIITTGEYFLLDPDDAQVYAYKRLGATEELLVVCNFTDAGQIRLYPMPEEAELLISNYLDDQYELLRPFEAKIYRYATPKINP